MSSVKNIKHRCCQLNVQSEECGASHFSPTLMMTKMVLKIMMIASMMISDDDDGDDGESCLYYLRDTIAATTF